MADHSIDDPLFDYKLYRFGRSRQLFRGPQPDLRGRYVCFLGASQTFGRFVDSPYPALIGARTGTKTLNLGAEGAGPGFFLKDPEVLHVASGAALCVVEAMCATAISNRMFSVRPRRNLRLHAVSEMLRGIYPDVDFDRFSFVLPMLRRLREQDEARFRIVENEMKNAWIGRMQTLLRVVETPTILFWFAQRPPEADGSALDGSAAYPRFVDRDMVETVRGAADDYVEVVTGRGLPQDLRVDGRAVLHRPTGEPINESREFPSPDMHVDAAEALIPAIERAAARAAP